MGMQCAANSEPTYCRALLNIKRLLNNISTVCIIPFWSVGVISFYILMFVSWLDPGVFHQIRPDMTNHQGKKNPIQIMMILINALLYAIGFPQSHNYP